MGWAKYFEDIQKIRDHASSLRDARIDDLAGISTPEKAIRELHRVHEALARWSEDLVAKLDLIIDQATDPEINRQIVIDDLNDEVTRLHDQIGALTSALEVKEVEKNGLGAELEKSRADAVNLKKSLDLADASFLSLSVEVDALQRKLTVYEKEAAKRQERRTEMDAFHDLMLKEGTRHTRK
jgi:chromosome segregation ATPase